MLCQEQNYRYRFYYTIIGAANGMNILKCMANCRQRRHGGLSFGPLRHGLTFIGANDKSWFS
jgi:hypothetical protein